jgi:Dyp-type peroxidase family protein
MCRRPLASHATDSTISAPSNKARVRIYPDIAAKPLDSESNTGSLNTSRSKSPTSSDNRLDGLPIRSCTIELEVSRCNTHGAVFVSFSADQKRLSRMLDSMAGIMTGTRDASTRFTQPLTGSYYFVPSVGSLRRLRLRNRSLDRQCPRGRGCMATSKEKSR